MLQLTSLKAQKPNIVIIISDDHAYQAIGAYGSKWMKTSGIDRIANEGALFTSSYVTNSICGPSRACILTGKYSHKNGFKDNENSNFDFSQNSFIKELKNAGYHTAWIGKMHLGDNIPEGFDEYNILTGQGSYYNPDFIETGQVKKRYPGYVTNIITDLANTWLKKTTASNQPFCLVIGHKATHRTWMPDLQDLGRFDSVNFDLPPTFYDDYNTRPAAKVQDMTIAQTMTLYNDLKIYDGKFPLREAADTTRMDAGQRKIWMAYYGKIKQQLLSKNLEGNALTEWKFQRYMRDYLSTAASLDRNINKTLDFLDKNGLTKNTIVIYMSDQGFYMGEHGWFDKRWMYEPSFRTPMMMRYPGVIQPGTKINDFIMNIDIGPTMLEAAGQAVPQDMQGKSFLPLLKKQNYVARKSMFYHYYENGQHQVSPHFGVRAGNYKLIRYYKRVNSWELFDLKNDPTELHNVYYESKYASVVKKMKKELLSSIIEYEDNEARALFYEPVP